MIENVPNHALQSDARASRIAAEIKDQRLVLADHTEYMIHGLVIKEKLRHLPDHNVAHLHPALPNYMILILFLADVSPEIICVALERKIQLFFALLHLGL